MKKIYSANDLIVRNDEPEQVWRVEYKNNYFQQVILVRGTWHEMLAYMESEMGFVGRHHALTEDEIRAAKKLDIKIYIAPELN